MFKSENVEFRNVSKEKTEIPQVCTKMRGTLKNPGLFVCMQVFMCITTAIYMLGSPMPATESHAIICPRPQIC